MASSATRGGSSPCTPTGASERRPDLTGGRPTCQVYDVWTFQERPESLRRLQEERYPAQPLVDERQQDYLRRSLAYAAA